MNGFLLFFPIAVVISVVFSSVKEDAPRTILAGSLKWFALLCLSILAGSGVVYAVGRYL